MGRKSVYTAEDFQVPALISGLCLIVGGFMSLLFFAVDLSLKPNIPAAVFVMVIGLILLVAACYFLATKKEGVVGHE